MCQQVGFLDSILPFLIVDVRPDDSSCLRDGEVVKKGLAFRGETMCD
jgi:hypothetical protein